MLNSVCNLICMPASTFTVIFSVNSEGEREAVWETGLSNFVSLLIFAYKRVTTVTVLVKLNPRQLDYRL